MQKSQQSYFWQYMLVTGLVLIAFFAVVKTINSPAISLGGISDKPVAIIGSYVGTTTTFNTFASTATTTATYIWKIDRSTDQVNLNLRASTTLGREIRISVEGSQDDECNTTNTATSTGTALASDIRWQTYTPAYSVSSNIATLPVGTSTSYFSWTPAANAKTGTHFALTDLNANCLRFTAVYASSSLFMTGTEKSAN